MSSEMAQSGGLGQFPYQNHGDQAHVWEGSVEWTWQPTEVVGLREGGEKVKKKKNFISPLPSRL